MRIYLTYNHSRNLFSGGSFKPFVRKYFEDVKFEGYGCGYWFPTISISGTVGNVKIKDLPKSYQPDKIEGKKKVRTKSKQLKLDVNLICSKTNDYPTLHHIAVRCAIRNFLCFRG